MFSLIARNWWTLVVRGVIAIMFGVLAYMSPGLTLASLMLAYGLYAIVDGILALVAAFSNRETQRPEVAKRPVWSLVLHGLCGIGAGLLTFAWPGITGMVLLMVIAAWAIVTGILEISAAIRLRREIKGEWLLGLAGVVSILFGVAMIARPAVGALSLAWMIGAYAMIYGVMMIVLGFKLRGFNKPAGEVPADKGLAFP